jgi:hypothetical protein
MMSQPSACLSEEDRCVEMGGPIPWFSASIVVVGDNLDPDAITDLLWVRPDESWRKGDAYGSNGGVRRMGAWIIEATQDNLGGASAQAAIGHLLARLPIPASLWQRACQGLQARLSLGLNLDTLNQGLAIEPAMLLRMGEMNLALDLDVYRMQPQSSQDGA